MTFKTAAELVVFSTGTFIDNTTGDISPLDFRNMHQHLTDSMIPYDASGVHGVKVLPTGNVPTPTPTGFLVYDGGVQVFNGTAWSGIGGGGGGGGDGDTTYTAGSGLQLVGTVFNALTASTSVTGVTVLTNTIDSSQSKALTPKAVNDANYLASGDNISVLVNDSGYLNAHPSISAASSSDNSGRTYIQDVLLDSNGHVTGVATASETGIESYTAGTGLALNSTTFDLNVASTVQTTAANSITTTASKTYSVQVDSSDNLVVNVPWASGSGGDITSVVAGSGLSGGGTTGDVTLNVSGVNTSLLQGTVPVSNGGTNATSFADKAVLITQDTGTNTVSAAVIDANGELLIGGTSGPAVATLTQGSNVTITNADGGITIAAADTTYTAGTGLALNGNEFYTSGDADFNSVTVATGVILTSATPAVTTNKLYNIGGTLYFNGSVVDSAGGGGGGANWTVADGLGNSEVISSGDTVYVSGVGSVTSTYATATNIISVSGTDTTYTAGSGIELSGTTFNAKTASTSASGITTLTNTIDTSETKALTPKAVNDANYLSGTLNQNTTGSAATLTTARAIAVTGDVTGTVNFDGSTNVSITTSLSAGAVDLAHMSDDSVGITELSATGTASSSTFLRGDNFWTTPTASVDIDALSVGADVHQTDDHFIFSDNGTEKKITFSSLQDAVFADVSGDGTIAAGGALTIADDKIGSGELVDACSAVTSFTAPLIEGSTSVQTPLIEYTNGDDAITIANGGACTFPQLTTFSKATKPTLKANTDAGTVTFDVNEANTHTVTIGANRIFAISNETAGQKFMIRILQDGTGSRTVTWFSTIKWAGGSAPTLTTTGGKADVVGFIVTGTDTYDGFVIGLNI
tara:strand:- start:7395 stop:9989 length:2595 start_codon:yes stop_codon:yes gene_type:complete